MTNEREREREREKWGRRWVAAQSDEETIREGCVAKTACRHHTSNHQTCGA